MKTIIKKMFNAMRDNQSLAYRLRGARYALCFFALGLYFFPDAFINSARLYAADMPKVLILDYVNVDKDSNFEYLGGSVTDAVREMLKKKFTFEESPRSEWEKVAADNFVFPEDYHTSTASLNLGLLCRQDVVISGGFRVETRKAAKKTGAEANAGEAKSEFETVIKISSSIYDVSSKRLITRFEVEGPASSQIFSSIQEVADRAGKEAAVVLPNKDDWQKKGAVVYTPPVIIFSDYIFGLRAGAGLYALGYASNLAPDQPFLSLVARASLPIIWSRLALQLQLDYNTHSLTPAKDSNLANLGVSGITSNLIPGLYTGVNFSLIKNMSLFAKIGGGLIMQSTKVTAGGINAAFSNYIGFAGFGADLSYALNNNIFPTLTLQSQLAFDGKSIMTINQISLGVNMKL